MNNPVKAQIVQMKDFDSSRKNKLENWLEEQIFQEYGDRDRTTVKNPLIRLSTKFEALSADAQYILYDTAKRAALGNKRKINMSKEFWNFLEMCPKAWEDIESFADKLLIKEIM